MMVGLLLYAYCTGVTSSRKIERKTQEDVAFRVLAANQSPDHSRISAFRRRHGVHFENLFVQMLKLCARAGLVKLGHVALDGTKLKANASKHKAMSYERMRKEEEKLRGRVKELLAQAEAVDAEEDARYGKGKRGDELPEELRRAQTRLERIRVPLAAGRRELGAHPLDFLQGKPGALPSRSRAFSASNSFFIISSPTMAFSRSTSSSAGSGSRLLRLASAPARNFSRHSLNTAAVTPSSRDSASSSSPLNNRSTASFFRFAENRPRSAVLSCFCCLFTSTSRGGGYPPERGLKKSWGGGNRASQAAYSVEVPRMWSCPRQIGQLKVESWQYGTRGVTSS